MNKVLFIEENHKYKTYAKCSDFFNVESIHRIGTIKYSRNFNRYTFYIKLGVRSLGEETLTQITNKLKELSKRKE